MWHHQAGTVHRREHLQPQPCGPAVGACRVVLEGLRELADGSAVAVRVGGTAHRDGRTAARAHLVRVRVRVKGER